jgi:hypothetical protein
MSDMRSGTFNMADMFKGDEGVTTVFTTERNKPIKGTPPQSNTVPEVKHIEPQESAIFKSSPVLVNHCWIKDRLPTPEESISHGGYFRINNSSTTARYDVYTKEWYIMDHKGDSALMSESPLTWQLETFE